MLVSILDAGVRFRVFMEIMVGFLGFLVGFLWDFCRVNLKGQEPMLLPGPGQGRESRP